MRVLRRILLTLVVIFAALCWIGPAGVLYFAKSAPAVAKVVPIELQDVSTSLVPGKKLSYFGYEFEVPWSDLDESQTQLFPEDKHDLHMAWVCFRSGLKLFIVISPREAVVPDYALLKRIYQVTPDKIHYWSLIEGWGYQDARLLLFKSAFLRDEPGSGSNPAELESSTSRARGSAAFNTAILEADPKYSNCASTPTMAESKSSSCREHTKNPPGSLSPKSTASSNPSAEPHLPK